MLPTFYHSHTLSTILTHPLQQQHSHTHSAILILFPYYLGHHLIVVCCWLLVVLCCVVLSVALRHLADLRVVHADIKLDNILCR